MTQRCTERQGDILKFPIKEVKCLQLGKDQHNFKACRCPRESQTHTLHKCCSVFTPRKHRFLFKKAELALQYPVPLVDAMYFTKTLCRLLGLKGNSERKFCSESESWSVDCENYFCHILTFHFISNSELWGASLNRKSDWQHLPRQYILMMPVNYPCPF